MATRPNSANGRENASAVGHGKGLLNATQDRGRREVSRDREVALRPGYVRFRSWPIVHRPQRRLQLALDRVTLSAFARPFCDGIDEPFCAKHSIPRSGSVA